MGSSPIAGKGKAVVRKDDCFFFSKMGLELEERREPVSANHQGW